MATTVKVVSRGKWEPGMQESDMMDQLPDGESRVDAETEQIMLVSLGCFCGPKLSFKNIGRGAETLPFDWMRTRHEGLVHFLRNGWDESTGWNGFFDFNTKKVVPGCSMTTYRSYYHSFWHDDPTDPGMHERYLRRIHRFNNIDATSKPVLFVRTVPTTEELKAVPELLELLIKRHGKHACLLLIIDFQKTADGPALVEGMDNIMVHYMPGSKHVNQEGLPAPPYGEAVNLALDWIVGRPVSVMQFDGWDTIMKCADRTDWGLNGLGGLWAFEPSLDSPEEEPLEPLPDPLPQLQPLTSMMLIETWACKAVDEDRPNVDDMKVVSLGSNGLVKASLLAMGIESPELPFDWLQISDSGVLHFIRHGWEAPTREGLGAGGQRPSEMHGFFDYMTRRSVPGTPLVMCRSFVHSFWHDDPAKPEVREKFKRLFTQFDELAKEERSLKLFVRAVATSSELGRARDLMEAVTATFGKQSALLLICDFQSKVQGPHMVDAYDDLLIYFLEGSAHKEAIPYKKPILAALDWIAGMELQVDVASDFKALEALAEPTLWGLRGLGGFNAFEMLPPDNDGDWQPGPEEKWLVDAKIEADNDNKAAETRMQQHVGSWFIRSSQAVSQCHEVDGRPCGRRKTGWKSMRRKRSSKRSSVDGDPAPKRRVRSKASAGTEGSRRAPAKGRGRAPKRQAEREERDDENEPELDDSDLDSSDLDATLMAVGGRDLEESGLMAQRIHARRQNRKKKKKRRKKTTRKAALQFSRENCQATPEARALLSRGQQQFYCGEFADAIETMRAVIREQPGLADPYHVLHQVYTELGEEKKAIHHLILCAYFTKPAADARPLWQKIGYASTRLSLVDQACYAFKRSLPARGSRTEDDWRSLWELSKLLFQKGSHDQGIEVLYELYEETEEPQLAVEVAKKLVRRHRWKECLALLESCVQKGRESHLPRHPVILGHFIAGAMSADEPNTRIENILQWQPIEGIYYPSFIKESAIRRLQQWEGREGRPAGDVFLVSNFPVRGLQRVLTCLVESRDNPWEGGLLDKPYYCESLLTFTRWAIAFAALP
eukprot:s167_g8.t2